MAERGAGKSEGEEEGAPVAGETGATTPFNGCQLVGICVINIYIRVESLKIARGVEAAD